MEKSAWSLIPLPVSELPLGKNILLSRVELMILSPESLVYLHLACLIPGPLARASVPLPDV